MRLRALPLTLVQLAQLVQTTQDTSGFSASWSDLQPSVLVASSWDTSCFSIMNLVATTFYGAILVVRQNHDPYVQAALLPICI